MERMFYIDKIVPVFKTYYGIFDCRYGELSLVHDFEVCDIIRRPVYIKLS